MSLILLAQNDLRFIEDTITFHCGPINPNYRIIPHETALIVRMINIVALIAEFSLIAQNQKALRESSGTKELPVVFSGKNNAFPLTVGRASSAKIDRQIKYGASHNTHELTLWMLNLKMQATQHAFCA